jgi:hypothetical protein
MMANGKVPEVSGKKKTTTNALEYVAAVVLCVLSSDTMRRTEAFLRGFGDVLDF